MVGRNTTRVPISTDGTVSSVMGNLMVVNLKSPGAVCRRTAADIHLNHICPIAYTTAINHGMAVNIPENKGVITCVAIQMIIATSAMDNIVASAAMNIVVATGASKIINLGGTCDFMWSRGAYWHRCAMWNCCAMRHSGAVWCCAALRCSYGVRRSNRLVSGH